MKLSLDKIGAPLAIVASVLGIIVYVRSSNGQQFTAGNNVGSGLPLPATAASYGTLPLIPSNAYATPGSSLPNDANIPLTQTAGLSTHNVVSQNQSRVSPGDSGGCGCGDSGNGDQGYPHYFSTIQSAQL